VTGAAGGETGSSPPAGTAGAEAGVQPPAHASGGPVALVNMPFAGFRQPSLALGLLKPAVEAVGASVSVLDATLTFAEMLGEETYDTIATWRPEDLLGDWVFAPALFDRATAGAADYEDQVLAGGAAAHDVPYFGKPPLTPQLRARLLEARERAGALLGACLTELVAMRPLAVGFTSMFHQHVASLALARRLKRTLPGTCVVFGGACCRGETGAELLRSFPFVDAVATGEGERVLPALVARLLRGEPPAAMPGLRVRGAAAGAEALRMRGAADDAEALRGRGAADEAEAPPFLMDRSPVPDYGDYFARLSGSPLEGSFAPRLPFETSRGCWWGERSRCVFCGQASDSLAFRRKSAGLALDQLEELTRRHPSCPVIVTDEVTAPDSFRDLVAELPRRVPDLQVVYLEVRPGLSKRRLRLLRDAGVRRLEAGVESLSTPVLRLMRKGTTALQGVALLKWARELGIEVVWNLLWGFPGEDPGEYERMAAMVPLLTHLPPPHAVGLFRVDRFSPLFEDPGSFGVTRLRPYPAYGLVYDLPEDALERLAYSFTFAYVTPTDVRSYTEPLAERIADWKRDHAVSMLAFGEEGDRVVVLERRPGFDQEEVTVLDGEHRHLFLACDRVRSATQLARELSAARGGVVGVPQTVRLLAELVDEGLMLRDGSSYLTLAMRLPRRG
jgi:ribosomal peptide maturation radical SAM protein 1